MARIHRNHEILFSVSIPLIGTATGILQWPDAVVFVLNLAALVPLLAWITRSVDALSVSVGRSVNELLKATLGNAVELMIGINAIIQARAQVSQSVILGSVLCKLLLVLGGSLFLSGYDKKRLRFDRTLTTILSSLMMVVFITLAIPTAMDAFQSAQPAPSEDILLAQRITSVTLVGLLLTFLVFRLKTHAAMFAGTPFHSGRHNRADSHIYGAQEIQIPQSYLGNGRATLILAAATLFVFTSTSYLVSSVGVVAKTLGTNETFLSLTLIPLFGNFTKYRTIIAGSRSNNQVEQGIRAVINSVLRITMLIAPLLVIVGWMMDQPHILKFDEFEATTLLLSVVVMTYLISDGRSNYFEGLMLVGTYVIIVFSFFVRPETPEDVTMRLA
ncbi:hypothetical protein NUU61_004233 [Penicillium alfredii]|uniref:Vacuolar calcium ion transporter n=1 Tax=Penicillium alfredii TaxID=1506179 RepID=A0A9W9FKR7_9EURO|nr:uncharacterized protein NUU61_004233 [Penicillium alfredii]KAJ5102011.1 hypothetical protein NUU61_004233 [Penicillium alfredii]